MSQSEISRSQTPLTADLYNNDDTTMIIARELVRFLLSQTESQPTVITRNRIVNAIKEIAERVNGGRQQFKKVYDLVNMILFDIYGFNLVGLPPKADDKQHVQELNPVDQHKATHFILLNKLDAAPQFDMFKLEQNANVYNEVVINEEYMGNDMSIPSDNTLLDKLDTDSGMVLKGLLSVVISVILFSKNNLLIDELQLYMQGFGVPTDGRPIPIVDMNFVELLKLFEKSEYILKIEEKSDIEGESIIYKIGRRTTAEFPLESLTAMVGDLMQVDPAELPELLQDVQAGIGNCY